MKKDLLNDPMCYMNADGYYNTVTGPYLGGPRPTFPMGTVATGTGSNTTTGTNLQQGGNYNIGNSGTQNFGGQGSGGGGNTYTAPPKPKTNTVSGPWLGGPKPTAPAGITTNPKTVVSNAAARAGDINTADHVNTDDPTQPGYIDPKEYDRTHDQHGNLIVATGIGGETPGQQPKKSIVPGISNTYLWISVGVLVVGGVLLYIRHKRK